MKKKHAEINMEILLEALNTVNELIAIKDLDGFYIYANKAVDEYYNSRYDTIVGKNYREIYPEKERKVIEQLDQEVIDSGTIISKTIQVLTDDGYIYFDSSRSPVFDEDGNIFGVISSGKNVTEREISKQKLKETINELELMNKRYFDLAYNDSLTNIGNRRKFYRDFLALDVNSKYNLVLIDLNNFKLINDQYGHSKGDNTLHDFAQLLKAIATKYNGDAYRLGGDEFTLLYPYNDISFEIEIEGLNVHLRKSHKNTSVSFGEIEVQSQCEIDTIYRDFVISRVDDLLYKYKRKVKKDT